MKQLILIVRVPNEVSDERLIQLLGAIQVKGYEFGMSVEQARIKDALVGL